jgi:hypothetical protein
MPKSDYDGAIFRVDPKTRKSKTRDPKFVADQLPEAQKGDVIAFNIKGEITSDAEKAACKWVVKSTSTNWFAKFATEGPDRGHLLNPFSIYYREGDDTRIEARRGSMRYEYKNVSEQAFNLYLKFLQTKIGAYRIDAERLVVNG